MANNQVTGTTEESQSIVHRAGDMAARAGERATDSVGGVLTSAAQSIRGTSEAMTDRLEGAGHYLQESDVRKIGSDITSMIRNHPKIAIGVGLGVGFLLGRMLAR